MAKKLLIDATHAEETRVVVMDGTRVEDFDFETIHKRQLAGNIYLAKVTRVEPSLQAAFVDYGGNRHGFLAFAEIHPDYYQIPVADRRALMEEERAMARDQDEDGPRRPRRRRDEEAEGTAGRDEATEAPVDAGAEATPEAEATPAAQPERSDAVQRSYGAMDVIDLGEDEAAAEAQPGDAPAAREEAPRDEEPETPYRAADHASEIDSEIESVADEDVSDEVRPPRRPRARRYKIQEVIKVRQIMLVQVVKEERGNKGAALTTYLSLAGRYCVLMPNTARGGGISRKITNVADRKKLKEIAAECDVPEGAGLIIRTAGANRTKQEIRRDYEYLFRLWEQIRDLTLKSIAPAPIYEEGNLIKRSIRDLYNKDIDEVLVEGEAGFRAARDFMKMIMPPQVGQVKLYNDTMPLFARYQAESYLAGMFNPTVQLKSGGYIVIGVTEALVAIDINSGKSTREGSIEDTALKTNLEAADEIARQLRLRDLAGLIVIDFIDMEERRNNAAVEKRLKDALRNDRARIQVGRISGFGLLEMSRQRLRPGMLEATTQPCPHCHGTGLIRSDNSIALAILRALEEEGTRNRSKEVLVKAPIGVVNYLFNAKREHLAQIELRYGMAIRLEADPALISPDYAIEKFKTATRVVMPVAPVVSLDAQTMSAIDEELEDQIPEEVEETTEAEAEGDEQGAEAAVESTPAGEGGDNGKRKRRRRRRRRGGQNGEGKAEGAGSDAEGDDGDEGEGDEAAPEAQAEVAAEPVVEPVAEAPEAEAADKPARKRRSRSRGSKAEAAAEGATEAVGEAPAEAVAEAEAPAAPKRTRSRRKPKAEEAPVAPEVVTVADTEAPAVEAVADVVQTPEAATAEVQATEAAVTEAPATEAPATEAAATGESPVPEAAEPEAAPPESAPESAPAPAPRDPNKPRRAGWWAKKGQ